MTRAGVLPSARAERAQFAEDVAYYLSQTPRQLPSQYLYDDVGSALFEVICRLPWYPITRVERELVRLHGREIFARISGLSTLIELGPGSGEKLETLLSAAGAGAMTVHLVDISRTALDTATRNLSAYSDLTVISHRATYEAGLAETANLRQSGGRTLVLFLGSNIGNFDPPGAAAMLLGVRATMRRGDALLLGADLVKPERELLLAYDDPLGVTSAFNKNLLVRVNRELGANFDVDAFVHRAVWTEAASRIEMHLISARRQEVHVPNAGIVVAFESGETIWTESSYKYRPSGIRAMLERAGFAVLEQWSANAFALTLASAD
jgi:L-histidine N-alpha-methyltransferase